MSTFGCNIENLLPSSDTIIDLLSSITRSFSNMLNELFSRITNPFANYSLDSFVEQGVKFQRQLLTFTPFGGSDFNARLSLRSMLGLSPAFKEDANAIEHLSGSISWITREKIDVTSMLRKMRDNE